FAKIKHVTIGEIHPQNKNAAPYGLTLSIFFTTTILSQKRGSEGEIKGKSFIFLFLKAMEE
ncbi:MAG: hypothetical protein RR444_05090, partial [Oscillospiraceae bacterium]